MSDEHIDDMLRELRDDLMAVRPSPEFAAKVRQQVATQPAHKWFGIWQIATAASVMALAALAIVLWSRQAPQHDAPAPVVIAAQNPPTPSAPVASSTTVVPTVAANQTTPRHAQVTQPPRVQQVAAREPEVLVPADQRMALVALLEGMRRRGNQVPSETTLMVDDEGRLPAPTEIKVSPITIEPLSPPVPGGGSRERR